MQKRWPWCMLLLGWALGLLSCAPRPEEPGDAQPYALLVLPDAIRLLALDTQSVDPRVRVRAIRVTPGTHRLRFAYAGASTQHVGQQNDPLCLETQAGHQYLFDTRTRGIIWRPVIEADTLISGYCTTHQCTEAEMRFPPQPPRLAFCPQ
jgi:hypothetical protein